VIRSMTGFGAGRAQAGAEIVAAEIRSVNGKFCEVRAHLPRGLAGLDQVVGKIVKARVARGVIDVTVRREGADGARTATATVDLPLAAAYTKAMRELREELGLAGDVTVHDLVGLEGVLVLTEPPPDIGPAADALERAIATALDALGEMRRRERLKAPPMIAGLAMHDIEIAGDNDGAAGQYRERGKLLPQQPAEYRRPDERGVFQGRQEGYLAVAEGLGQQELPDGAGAGEDDEYDDVAALGCHPLLRNDSTRAQDQEHRKPEQHAVAGLGVADPAREGNGDGVSEGSRQRQEGSQAEACAARLQDDDHTGEADENGNPAPRPHPLAEQGHR